MHSYPSNQIHYLVTQTFVATTQLQCSSMFINFNKVLFYYRNKLLNTYLLHCIGEDIVSSDGELDDVFPTLLLASS